jgi:hypothetical protein
MIHRGFPVPYVTSHPFTAVPAHWTMDYGPWITGRSRIFWLLRYSECMTLILTPGGVLLSSYAARISSLLLLSHSVMHIN